MQKSMLKPSFGSEDTSRQSPDVYIIGGSNSLLNGGWSHQFANLVNGRYNVANLSIGAATTLIGLYRILTNKVRDGGIVVWEYALNEQNHFLHGQSVESLVAHLDWFLELCARRRIKVLPLLAWNRAELHGGEAGAYRDAQEKLWSRRGLLPLDLKPALSTFAIWKGVQEQALYSDNAHYGLGTGFPRWIAAAVLQHLPNARVPAAEPSLKGRDLVLAYPGNPPTLHFANRILTAPAWHLDAPLRINASGRLLGAYLMASAAGAAVEIKVDGRSVGIYSARAPSGPKQPVRLMKHWVLWKRMRDCHVVREEVLLHRAHGNSRPEVQNMFAPLRGVVNGPEEAVMALLVEQDKGDPTAERPGLRAAIRRVRCIQTPRCSR